MIIVETPIEEIVAGFIVWLARRGVEVDRRRRCPGLAREFLRWQREQRHQLKPCELDDYLAELGRNGGPSEHGQLRDAVQMLGRYLAECD